MFAENKGRTDRQPDAETQTNTLPITDMFCESRFAHAIVYSGRGKRLKRFGLHHHHHHCDYHHYRLYRVYT